MNSAIYAKTGKWSRFKEQNGSSRAGYISYSCCILSVLVAVSAWITASVCITVISLEDIQVFKKTKQKKKLLKLSPEQWVVTVPIKWWVGKCHYAKLSRSRLEACGWNHLVSAFSSALLRLVFAVTTWCSHSSWPYCALCWQLGFMKKVNVMFLPRCLHSSAFPADLISSSLITNNLQKAFCSPCRTTANNTALFKVFFFLNPGKNE